MLYFKWNEATFFLLAKLFQVVLFVSTRLPAWLEQLAPLRAFISFREISFLVADKTAQWKQSLKGTKLNTDAVIIL